MLKPYRFFLMSFLVPALLFSEEPAPSTSTPPQSAPPPAKEEMTHQIEKAKEEIHKTVPSAFNADAAKIVMTLFGLIAFLVIAGWALKRMTGARAGLFGSSKGIKILERKAISPKSVLYIVEAEGKKVLISESQFDVRALTHLEDEVSKE